MTVFYIIQIFSLLTGLLIYVLFRENTYISKIILSQIPLTEVKALFSCLECDFVKYYLPDFLWALSLGCGIYIILKPQGTRQALLCSLITFLSGLCYELLQLYGIISGTGDVIDISLYFSAALTVNIIYLGEKKYEKNN
ncbi:MAG: hypothetical protein IKD04_05350 [Clostridia bacterium]|nr:hypothetical protein [Clostridia bacterium]